MVWAVIMNKKNEKKGLYIYIFFLPPSPPQTHVWRNETSVSSVVLLGRGAVSLCCKEDVLRHEKWAGDKNPTGKFSSCASVEQQERKKKKIPLKGFLAAGDRRPWRKQEPQRRSVWREASAMLMRRSRRWDDARSVAAASLPSWLRIKAVSSPCSTQLLKA